LRNEVNGVLLAPDNRLEARRERVEPFTLRDRKGHITPTISPAKNRLPLRAKVELADLRVTPRLERHEGGSVPLPIPRALWPLPHFAAPGSHTVPAFAPL